MSLTQVANVSDRMTPFASAFDDLTRLGYRCVPLIAPSAPHGGKGKAPGSFVAGRWQGMTRWQRYRDEGPSSFDLNLWRGFPDANIGLLLGSPAGDQHVIALDADATDPDVLDTLLRAMPASPMVKRGAKGETRFYRASKTIKSKPYDGPDGRLLDLLSGFDTRQTVVPPSIHPATGQPYVWTRGPIAAAELPEFTDDDLQALEEALESVGWARAGRQKDWVPDVAAFQPGVVDDSNPFAVANAAALADLDAWFPSLGLYGARRARGGWEAVADYRASGTNRPLEERKRNLSVQINGIKDWGASGRDASLSAIDLVMRALDLSEGAALSWLEERVPSLRLADDVVIALGGGAGAEVASRVATAPRSAPTVPGEAGTQEPKCALVSTHGSDCPAHLLDVPGLVGDIQRWIIDTSVKPQPLLALAAALTLVGTLAGRRFSGPTHSGTHLYLLAVARSGTGKEHPRRAITQLLGEAMLSHFMGPGAFMSGSAVLQTVAKHPALVSHIDEFGAMLARLNGKSASSHERHISGLWRELWSSSFTTMPTPAWAASQTRATMPPIVSPAFSIVGYSTPSELFDALQGNDVSSGFLNRFMLFATSSNPPARDPDLSVFDVPEALIERVRSIALAGPPLATATMHTTAPSKPLFVIGWDGGKDGEAAKIWKALRDGLGDRAEDEALLQRVAENAIRLATIRAIGRAGEAAVITAEDASWACDLALWSANRMIADVAANMAETQHQANALWILRLIREAGSIGHAELARKVNHKFSGRDIKGIVEGLVDAGQVSAITASRTGAGRRATTYEAIG